MSSMSCDGDVCGDADDDVDGDVADMARVMGMTLEGGDVIPNMCGDDDGMMDDAAADVDLAVAADAAMTCACARCA